MTEIEKKRIADAIADLELSIQHVKRASLVGKAKSAEALADSSLVVVKLMAGALGVNCDY